MENAKTVFTRVMAPPTTAGGEVAPAALFPHLMAVLVLLTLVSLFHVWSRVQVIELNLQLNEAGRQLKEYKQEGTRLRLEIASLKTPARIETLAKGELGMVLPAEQQMIVVR
ncbi:MAG TPA: cell division protein FtsL [Verrucomicrobiae bacterium]|nr:cell division protein FtsL [Verrucomicrobiae bacterium]